MALSEKHVGPYRILEQLGAGGMGEVYLARDTRLERDVALKMLPSEVARDARRMALFRGEALALAAINHPNIATIFGFEDSIEGMLALVLERVEGVTLAERLRGGAMPMDEALGACLQIAEALEAAHARGVVHRDLKPGNIMIGSRGTVKVLDFGLAHRQGAPGTDSDATIVIATPVTPDASNDTHAGALLSGGTLSGTPSYMSPEQVQGTAEDQRTDVFAFGCLLYECLTGGRAFDGATPREVWSAILSGTPDWAALPPRTPQRIRDLIQRCLEKAPERRLASMSAARFEIDEVRGARRASAGRKGGAAPDAPHHMPFQTTSFVERARVTEECLALCHATRLLTITGAGGGGKTRLAMRLAELLVGEFRDGVWFVDLASLNDGAGVPDVVATALGVTEEVGRSVTESVAHHLAKRKALVILDNCEHLLVACAKLARSLLSVAPDLKMIATSREALGVQGEATYSVPSMSLPDPKNLRDLDAVRACEAVQLFVDRAMLVRQDFKLDEQTGPDVVEICRRLDGIPLAIELAAARVRVLSVQQILERLHDRFRLLAGGRGALPRHQTLRASIQWSYDQLTPDEQRLLRQVAVFAGGWTLESATACSEGWDEFRVLDLLARLVDKSLVIVERQDREDTRYRCLETVRQYGEELLVERGEIGAARDRHRDWVITFTEREAKHQAGEDVVRSHDRMEVERDNLRTALAWCHDDPNGAEAGLRLVEGAEWFWAVRGYFREGRQWIADVLSRGPFPPSSTLARVLKGAGNLAWRQDDYSAARTYYSESLEVLRQLGDEAGMAGALGSLGNVAQNIGEWHEARSLFEQTLEISRRHGHKIWQGTALTCLGNVNRNIGDFEASRRYLEEAIAVTQESGNIVSGAIAIGSLGDLLVDLGDYEAAAPYLEQEVALQEKIGDPHSLAIAQFGFAVVLGRRGDHAGSRALFQRSLRSLIDLGGRLHVTLGVEDLADLVLLEGNTPQAVRLLAAADAQRQSLHAPQGASRKASIERRIAIAREALGEGSYAAEWERGRQMTLEQVISEVFGDSAPPENPT